MTMEIRIPDIGDFANVPVMEILVKPGDEVTVDQTLLVLESDKATLDVPSPVAGRIDSVLVGPGTRVSQGTMIATIEPSRERTSTAPPTDSPAEANTRSGGPVDRSPVEPLVVIGGGPGGYSAAFRAADLGLDVVLIEREAKLGGVCLNVGCIPSKALLHVAAMKTEAERLSVAGLRFGPAEIDLERLRAFKDATVNRLTTGLQHMARQRRVSVITGEARFVDAHRLSVALADGREQSVGFSQCIVAVGSAPVHLSALPTDPRIVDSTGALELPLVPERLLVIGGGIIGLEMATVYAALGSCVDIVERADSLLPGDVYKRQGMTTAPHSHPYEQIFMILKGRVTLHVGDESFDCPAGTIVRIPPNVIHWADGPREEDGPALNMDVWTPLRPDYAEHTTYQTDRFSR